MGPSLLRPILVRAASLGAVLVIVLFLLVMSLGATGYSDRILEAQVSEELRVMRTGLAETITDPDAVEEIIAARRTELEEAYGLDQTWYERLPAVVARVIVFDLGDARDIRAADGSNDVGDIILDGYFLPEVCQVVGDHAGYVGNDIVLFLAICAKRSSWPTLQVLSALRAGESFDKFTQFFQASFQLWHPITTSTFVRLYCRN